MVKDPPPPCPQWFIFFCTFFTLTRKKGFCLFSVTLSPGRASLFLPISSSGNAGLIQIIMLNNQENCELYKTYTYILDIRHYFLTTRSVKAGLLPRSPVIHFLTLLIKISVLDPLHFNADPDPNPSKFQFFLLNFFL